MIDDCEWRLLQAIANPQLKLRDVVEVYQHAKRFGEDVNWERVHQEIIHRWSCFALEWIRREAGKR